MRDYQRKPEQEMEAARREIEGAFEAVKLEAARAIEEVKRLRDERGGA